MGSSAGTPYTSKFKILNHNLIFQFYNEQPGNTSSRNRNVDSRTASGLQGGLTRASRGLNGNTTWGDPEEWLPSSYLLGELLEGDAHVLQPKLFPDYLHPEIVCGQQEHWWPGSWLLSHLLHSGEMDLGSQLHCHAQVTDGDSGVQWDVQSLYCYVYSHPSGL